LLIVAGLLVSALTFRAASPAANGSAIFKENCAMCHGDDGKGSAAMKTPDFTSSKWQASTTNKTMRDVIKNGKKGTGMMAFGNKLKDDDVSAVIAYIRSLKKK
jgi:cytochrome c oxidase cbb3-type subunit 3